MINVALNPRPHWRRLRLRVKSTYYWVRQYLSNWCRRRPIAIQYPTHSRSPFLLRTFFDGLWHICMIFYHIRFYIKYKIRFTGRLNGHNNLFNIFVWNENKIELNSWYQHDCSKFWFWTKKMYERTPAQNFGSVVGCSRTEEEKHRMFGACPPLFSFERCFWLAYIQPLPIRLKKPKANDQHDKI